MDSYEEIITNKNIIQKNKIAQNNIEFKLEIPNQILNDSMNSKDNSANDITSNKNDNCYENDKIQIFHKSKSVDNDLNKLNKCNNISPINNKYID